MSHRWTAPALALGMSLATPPLNAAANDRPNIVFILADDLGAGDLPLYGRTDLRTPALDRLAAEGVLFTQAYAAAPECTPTRTSFLTGRYLQRVDGLECAIGTGNVGRYDDAIRVRAENALGLPASEPTIGQYLQGAGYATGLFGKWHLGLEEYFSPVVHGFDESLYILEGEADYFHYSTDELGPSLRANGQPATRTGYFTEVVSTEAVDFIERHAGDPFFLYLAYTAPHSPYQGPGDYRPEPLGTDDPLYNQSKAPPATYRAMIESLDEGIGRVLDKLDDLGLTGETLVVFTSDNGGTGSARNAPFRGKKSQTYEGGLREPAIARWPGHLSAGSQSDQVTVTMDFTKSFLRVAGVEVSAHRPLDGIDIIQHLENGEPSFPRQLFWRARRGENTWWAVRDGDWKYVRQKTGSGSPGVYLFDLEKDIGENTNLGNSRSADRVRLENALAEWEQQMRPPTGQWRLLDDLQNLHPGEAWTVPGNSRMGWVLTSAPSVGQPQAVGLVNPAEPSDTVLRLQSDAAVDAPLILARKLPRDGLPANSRGTFFFRVRVSSGDAPLRLGLSTTSIDYTEGAGWTPAALADASLSLLFEGTRVALSDGGTDRYSPLSLPVGEWLEFWLQIDPPNHRYRAFWRATTDSSPPQEIAILDDQGLTRTDGFSFHGETMGKLDTFYAALAAPGQTCLVDDPWVFSGDFSLTAPDRDATPCSLFRSVGWQEWDGQFAMSEASGQFYWIAECPFVWDYLEESWLYFFTPARETSFVYRFGGQIFQYAWAGHLYNF